MTLTPCHKGPGKVHCKVMDGDTEQLRAQGRSPCGHHLQTARDRPLVDIIYRLQGTVPLWTSSTDCKGSSPCGHHLQTARDRPLVDIHLQTARDRPLVDIIYRLQGIVPLWTSSTDCKGSSPCGHHLQTARDRSPIKGGGCTICTVYQCRSCSTKSLTWLSM